jgi:hypothetical protein
MVVNLLDHEKSEWLAACKEGFCFLQFLQFRIYFISFIIYNLLLYHHHHHHHHQSMYNPISWVLAFNYSLSMATFLHLFAPKVLPIISSNSKDKTHFMYLTSSPYFSCRAFDRWSFRYFLFEDSQQLLSTVWGCQPSAELPITVGGGPYIFCWGLLPFLHAPIFRRQDFAVTLPRLLHLRIHCPRPTTWTWGQDLLAELTDDNVRWS